MTDLAVDVSLSYAVGQETAFAFSIVAARTRHQSVQSEEIDVSGGIEWEMAPYGEGTHQLVRLVAPAGDLDVSYRARIAIRPHEGVPSDLGEVPFGDIPADILPNLNPSRYCESDKISDLAWRLFADTPPGLGRVRAISDWVEENVSYTAGSTNVSSSATDVLLQRAGVCRDFAHVAITFCRALGVPARYVSGYGYGVKPQDFHGFFEAYIGSDWYLFDPTGMSTPSALARIGYGRDAADAPFATLVGRAVLTAKSVDVRVDGEVDEAAPAASTA